MNRDPAVIDVQAELAHWQTRQAEGGTGIDKFSELATVVKMACDIYLQAPHSSESERLLLFRHRSEQHFLCSGIQQHYESLARACWRRLERPRVD